MKEDQPFSYDFDNAERIGYLIASYIKGTLTPLERKELDEWILQSEQNEILFDELTDEKNIEKTVQWYASVNEEEAARRIKKRISFSPQRKRTTSYPFVFVAASLLIVLSFLALYFITQKKGSLPEKSTVTVQSNDPLPGTDKAVLTLADGRQIVLDSSATSRIAANGIRIENGTISYDAIDVPSENLITVPRGGQYKVLLSDGTKVWLNAESSLRYATSFTGSERKVVLTGEGFFEVSKNKEKPFIVESSGNTIKVLGTQFNVNSYGDENAFIATLVEGSVQITHGTLSKRMNPGEEARVTVAEMKIETVDTYEATAWKEGEFVFRNATVFSVVSQIARWYNLQVEFRDHVDKHLNATIKRNESLSKVLHYLEQTGEMHFKLEGKKLIVMK